jgi:hypothetical protein
MDVTLTVAILGAVVTALGWLITHILSISAERRRQRLIAQLEYTKQQLEELYGPIAFLILEGQQTFRDLFAAQGWEVPLPLDKELSKQESQIWFFWVEHDFFPRNKKIQELLSSKTHLIEGERVPESFLTFLDHYNSWYINHLRWQEQGIEYGWHSKIGWPNSFDDDILSTFRKLKKRHAILIGMIVEARSFRFQVWRKIPQKQIDQEASRHT